MKKKLTNKKYKPLSLLPPPLPLSLQVLPLISTTKSAKPTVNQQHPLDLPAVWLTLRDPFSLFN